MESAQFGGTYWQVLLPPGWAGSHDPECDLIFDPQGVGALQVSAAVKSGGVTDEDLHALALDELSRGITHAPVQAGDFQGFTFVYDDGSNHWQRWFLRHGPVALFMTYNCRLDDVGQEDGPVRTILESLRARVPA